MSSPLLRKKAREKINKDAKYENFYHFFYKIHFSIQCLKIKIMKTIDGKPQVNVTTNVAMIQSDIHSVHTQTGLTIFMTGGGIKIFNLGVSGITGWIPGWIFIDREARVIMIRSIFKSLLSPTKCTRSVLESPFPLEITNGFSIILRCEIFKQYSSY